MVYDGNKGASWRYIEQIYKLDAKITDCVCTKLIKDHVYPEGNLNMRVNLATQVFSTKVCGFMKDKIYYGILPNSNSRSNVPTRQPLNDSS